MTDLNAEITTESMRLLKLAKAIHDQPIRVIVQEAVDKWLAANGITAAMLRSPLAVAPKPRRKSS